MDIRRISLVAALLATVAFAPAPAFCDPDDADSGGSGGPNLAAAAGPTFDAAFDHTTHDSCLKGVPAGVSRSSGERFCNCFVNQLEPLSEGQKVTLTPDSPAYVAATQACQGYLRQR